MPDMAKIVMDKSIWTVGNLIFHNYEFLDDTYILNPYHENNDEKEMFPTQEMTPFYTMNSPKAGQLKENCICREKRYKTVQETHPITLMQKNRLYDLLNHDLVQSYVTTKWNKFAKWFYYGLCSFHFLFVLFLTFITINIKPERTMTDEEKQRLSQTSDCLVGVCSIPFSFHSIPLYFSMQLPQFSLCFQY
uniref:Uncharacterized protein n=1 Tax=Panagrolaimus sp. JU765 TaxID=591449 RepID=A0AC34PX47_9BILA